VCNDCGIVQRSRLAFTGQEWSNDATTYNETDTSENVVHERTRIVIDSICERLELDSSVCNQAKEELRMFYKVRHTTLPLQEERC
jgi:transcription initiation factor TFIIIB Brf1 subunit/transcription initiation factor TFIIB